MAHGYLSSLCREEISVFSAGVETHGVNPGAVTVMQEEGIDISNHTSNHVDEYRDLPFGIVLTVCDHAQERCPFFPTKAIRLHYNFPDPAKAKGSKAEIMESFRATRDLIKVYCEELVEKHELS